ncbi:hypothetical protein B0H10DRAFT_1958838 [Mycena sp. CBHHK59/15]|nr:hypothetical protein B0H10DRAFT_1958838 [Mycena sp. CBHHK59/15]
MLLVNIRVHFSTISDPLEDFMFTLNFHFWNISHAPASISVWGKGPETSMRHLRKMGPFKALHRPPTVQGDIWAARSGEGFDELETQQTSADITQRLVDEIKREFKGPIGLRDVEDLETCYVGDFLTKVGGTLTAVVPVTGVGALTGGATAPPPPLLAVPLPAFGGRAYDSAEPKREAKMIRKMEIFMTDVC